MHHRGLSSPPERSLTYLIRTMATSITRQVKCLHVINPLSLACDLMCAGRSRGRHGTPPRLESLLTTPTTNTQCNEYETLHPLSWLSRQRAYPLRLLRLPAYRQRQPFNAGELLGVLLEENRRRSPCGCIVLLATSPSPLGKLLRSKAQVTPPHTLP